MNEQIEIYRRTALNILKNKDCLRIPECKLCLGDKTKKLFSQCSKQYQLEISRKAITLWNQKKLVDFLIGVC